MMTSSKYMTSSKRSQHRNWEGQRSHQEGQRSLQQEMGFRTVAAYGPNLTCIRIPKDDSCSGNIHSGALPPWLQTDDSEPGSASPSAPPIGPTAEDFAKHLKNLKKRKLPSTRVGAKFDRSSKTSDTWLPLFGRVWSKNRRQHSKSFFTKALNFNKGRDSRNSDSTGTSSKYLNGAAMSRHKISESGRSFNVSTISSRAQSNGLSFSSNSSSRLLPGAYKRRRNPPIRSTAISDRPITVAQNLL